MVGAASLPYELVNRSNPALLGTAFTARLIMMEGRLLMMLGMGGVTMLENKNLQDPSHPEDWVPAEGNGTVEVNFAGAPTSKHEDYRYHHFEKGYTCQQTNQILEYGHFSTNCSHSRKLSDHDACWLRASVRVTDSMHLGRPPNLLPLPP
jgi:hypothetical protein